MNEAEIVDLKIKETSEKLYELGKRLLGKSVTNNQKINETRKKNIN